MATSNFLSTYIRDSADWATTLLSTGKTSHLFLVSGTAICRNLISLHLQRLRRGTTGPRLSQQTATPPHGYCRAVYRTTMIYGFSQSRSQMTEGRVISMGS